MIKLGEKVKDMVTGIEGIAVAKCEYLNGCIQYSITPKSVDNKIPKDIWVDERQIEYSGQGVTLKPVFNKAAFVKNPGGFQHNTPSGMNTPKSIGEE